MLMGETAQSEEGLLQRIALKQTENAGEIYDTLQEKGTIWHLNWIPTVWNGIKDQAMHYHLQFIFYFDCHKDISRDDFHPQCAFSNLQ